ncbi:CapA family protein [Raoultibacter phocaeensis]|uniref:CapA family protein n=1 Tax=Raoultibacter phocaeensis TaxID=2479841 RepID=UPI001118A75D|nr:CapA family protein [Raoultibacter phocaeensis]
MGGSRRVVHRRRAEYGRAAIPYRYAVASLLVVVVVAGGVFALTGVFGGESAGEPTGDPAAPAETGVSFEPSGKLVGATETVDEYGIVHGKTTDGVQYLLWGRGSQSLQADKVTLVAAGDQIGSDQVLELTDGYGGTMGDGAYDFTPFYQEVAPFIQNFDLRFINQETVMAGTEQYGYSGYPSFNTPDAAADAISATGFNMVNLATNHVLDYGVDLADRSLGVWDSHPQIMTAGSYRSQDERETVRMIERNGMTFAFLAFCYGDNYYQQNLPNSWNLCGFDKAAIEADVKRAQQVADAVIVAMHWGTEYQSEPNDQQLDYASFLADLDVDLVLGTHAHTVQPVRFMQGASGNEIPVVFGLSDFISGWSKTDAILSGLFTCDFVRVQDDGADAKSDHADDSGSWHVEVSNLAWHPTIEWSDGGEVYVRFLSDMDEQTTNANTRTPDVDNDYAYLRERMDAMGMEIPVIW